MPTPKLKLTLSKEAIPGLAMRVAEAVSTIAALALLTWSVYLVRHTLDRASMTAVPAGQGVELIDTATLERVKASVVAKRQVPVRSPTVRDPFANLPVVAPQPSTTPATTQQ